jgi:hypothetical protein
MTNVGQARCLHDTEWRRQPGFASTLKIGARVGTTAFSRLNSSIQTYELANDVRSTNITAAQLLATFEGFFTGRSSEGNESESTEFLESLMAGFTGQVDMGPVFIGSYFAMGPLMYGTQNIAARDAIGLYSLVAKILWWCSIPIGKSIPTMETGVSPLTWNLTDTLGTGFTDLAQATYSLATSRYELIVSPATIIAYGVLGGLVLLLCVGALLLSTVFTSTMRRPPATSAFPDLDSRRLSFGEIDSIPKHEHVDIGDKRLREGFVTFRKQT